MSKTQDDGEAPSQPTTGDDVAQPPEVAESGSPTASTAGVPSSGGPAADDDASRSAAANRPPTEGAAGAGGGADDANKAAEPGTGGTAAAGGAPAGPATDPSGALPTTVSPATEPIVFPIPVLFNQGRDRWAQDFMRPPFIKGTLDLYEKDGAIPRDEKTKARLDGGDDTWQSSACHVVSLTMLARWYDTQYDKTIGRIKIANRAEGIKIPIDPLSFAYWVYDPQPNMTPGDYLFENQAVHPLLPSRTAVETFIANNKPGTKVTITANSWTLDHFRLRDMTMSALTCDGENLSLVPLGDFNGPAPPPAPKKKSKEDPAPEPPKESRFKTSRVTGKTPIILAVEAGDRLRPILLDLAKAEAAIVKATAANAPDKILLPLAKKRDDLQASAKSLQASIAACDFTTSHELRELRKSSLKKALMRGPVLLNMLRPAHFVLGVGYRGDRLYINDPGKIIDPKCRTGAGVPDPGVWELQLHANELISIDPEAEAVFLGAKTALEPDGVTRYKDKTPYCFLDSLIGFEQLVFKKGVPPDARFNDTPAPAIVPFPAPPDPKAPKGAAGPGTKPAPSPKKK